MTWVDGLSYLNNFCAGVTPEDDRMFYEFAGTAWTICVFGLGVVVLLGIFCAKSYGNINVGNTTVAVPDSWAASPETVTLWASFPFVLLSALGEYVFTGRWFWRLLAVQCLVFVSCGIIFLINFISPDKDKVHILLLCATLTSSTLFSLLSHVIRKLAQRHKRCSVEELGPIVQWCRDHSSCLFTYSVSYASVPGIVALLALTAWFLADKPEFPDNSTIIRLFVTRWLCFGTAIDLYLVLSAGLSDCSCFRERLVRLLFIRLCIFGFSIACAIGTLLAFLLTDSAEISDLARSSWISFYAVYLESAAYCCNRLREQKKMAGIRSTHPSDAV